MSGRSPRSGASLERELVDGCAEGRHRSDAATGESTQQIRSPQRRKEKISELVPGSKLASIVAKLEHYRALAVYRGGQLDEAKALVTKLDYGSPQEADGLYFTLVKQAINSDQKSADAPPEP